MTTIPRITTSTGHPNARPASGDGGDQQGEAKSPGLVDGRIRRGRRAAGRFGASLRVSHPLILSISCRASVPTTAVGVDHGVDPIGTPPIMPGEDGIEYVGDGHPADPPRQEGGHRLLVGGVEHRRRGLALPPGLVGQAEAGEGVMVGRLEVEAAARRPVDAAEGRGDAVGPRQGVADGQAHVGVGELGDGGAVGHLDHGVHDRLRVDHDVDGVVVDVEQLVGLDHLQALVHERR